MEEIDIIEEPMTALDEYSRIPCSFIISRMMEVRELDGGIGGLSLAEKDIASPREENYDLFPPSKWTEWFDLSSWVVISAFSAGVRVGGCVLAYESDVVKELGGGTDMTVLFDIRVAPAFRRHGIASRLFMRAVE